MTTIGLFGTCDKNPWRAPFIEKYEAEGIDYFNPMKDDWDASMAKDEAKHLASDEVVLFPILGWSYGVGSLSELGFGPLKAMRQNMQRSFVVLIETEMHERLEDKDRCKDSVNARKIVLAHLKELAAPNIYLVDSLDEMLEKSLKLHKIHKTLSDLSQTA